MPESPADEWIRVLRLERHPEGGYYRETYRSNIVIPAAALPPEFEGSRNAATAIYFLLKGGDFSAFHRIRADETWHFYAGSPLWLYAIDSQAVLSRIELGPDPETGATPQTVIPKGHWFAAQTAPAGSYSLVGCTTAPGFDFRDFEQASRENLIRQYPRLRSTIEAFTR